MVPYCCGLRRPRILIPASLLREGAELRLRAVLLHEASHLRRRDPWGRAGAAAAAPILYWNPLYWWLVRDSQRCAEVLADDAAAQRLGKRTYAAELLALVESTDPRPHPAPGTPLLPNPSDLLPRMNMLFQRSHPLPAKSTRRQRITRHSFAALILGGVTLAWGRVPDPAPAEPRHPEIRTTNLPTPGAAAPMQSSPESRAQVQAASPEPARLIALLAELSAAPDTTLDRVRIHQTESGTRDTHVLRFEIAGPALLELVRQGSESSGVNLQSFRSMSLARANPMPPETIRIAGKNIDVLDLITHIATAGGLNIVVDPGVQGTLTVAFEGISARQALESSVGTLGYCVTGEGPGVLRVGPDSGAGKD